MRRGKSSRISKSSSNTASNSSLKRAALTAAIDRDLKSIPHTTLVTFPKNESDGPIELLSLPIELIMEIFKYISWADCYSVSQTSSLLRALSLLPNSLFSSRYSHFPSPGPVCDAGEPAKVHRIFETAIYRNGVAYFSSDDCEDGMARIEIASTPFANDPFSCPQYNRIVISWVFMSMSSLCADRPKEDTMPLWKYVRLSRGAGGLYVNNIIDGKKSEKTGSIAAITILDIFEALASDHAVLQREEEGQAEILGFHHVFHAGSGATGGNHFEVRWTWVEKGMDTRDENSMVNFLF